MKKFILKIQKKECTDTCPLPLEVIPQTEKTIKRINYNKKTKCAEILYDDKKTSEEDIKKMLRKRGYIIEK